MPSDDAQTVVPGPERCLEVLDDIVRTWRVGTGGPTVHTRFARQFVPVIWANTCHLVALAEGLVTLHRAGLHLAAMPLVRQIIEFAMRCVWMERYRENVGAVIVEGAKKRRLALETAVSTGILASDDPVVAEAREVVANAVLDHATSGKVFETLCKEIQGGEKVYAYYRIASNYTHPSLMLTDLYLVEDKTSPVGLRLATSARPTPEDAWLGISTSLVILGCLAWDRVDRNHPHRALLRGYAKEFGVPTGQATMTNEGFIAWNKANRARGRAHASRPR
ncbi:DUF5677 domain-containing protein [Actinotalea fermentans]|uniref:Uncharacterized protein n=1 Tax=Actinotalea fermentans TaxID=43671 RepID=A0A511YYG3_9CELL|nr:DUF5677 domain-containing protein [Actinotalea fermentans]KGM17833.1 hypothetical protein N867_08735 [Actinotalea fermentans ATCC 43279 = JCM 9966 = DSM 3133]GEN80228.1 hypothetical protein AFE02nite_19620 [Actinotalea fermentans]